MFCGGTVLNLSNVFLFSTFCPFQFGNHLDLEKRAGCFTLIVFLMSSDCQCCVTLIRGAVGWSVVWYFLIYQIQKGKLEEEETLHLLS